MTQAQKLLALLRSEPGVSSLEVTLKAQIVNVTGRVSDLRAEGYDIVARRDREGVYRYRLIEPGQRSLGL